MKNSQLTSHSVKAHTLKAPSPHQDQEDKLRHSYCCCESVGESERASERERDAKYRCASSYNQAKKKVNYSLGT